MFWLQIPLLAVLPLGMSLGRLLLGTGGWLTIGSLVFLAPVMFVIQGLILVLGIARASKEGVWQLGRLTTWPFVGYAVAAMAFPLGFGDYGDAPGSESPAPLEQFGVSADVAEMFGVGMFVVAAVAALACIVLAIVDLVKTPPRPFRIPHPGPAQQPSGYPGYGPPPSA